MDCDVREHYRDGNRGSRVAPATSLEIRGWVSVHQQSTRAWIPTQDQERSEIWERPASKSSKPLSVFSTIVTLDVFCSFFLQKVMVQSFTLEYPSACLKRYRVNNTSFYRRPTNIPTGDAHLKRREEKQAAYEEVVSVAWRKFIDQLGPK